MRWGGNISLDENLLKFLLNNFSGIHIFICILDRVIWGDSKQSTHSPQFVFGG